MHPNPRIGDADGQKQSAGFSQTARSEPSELLVIVHDIRSPLGVIELTARFIQEQSPDRQAVDVGMERIRRATHRIDRLAQDLLDMATRERQMFEMRLARVPARQLLTDARTVGETLAASMSITFEFEDRPDLPPVWVDADLIARVFENLVGNAVKFTPQGGRIAMRARTVGNEIHFSVADTGIGLSEKDRARAFQPYWQYDPGDRRGLGLGLWICREIVTAHGGRIWIDADTCAGATVIFSLPVAADPA